MKIQGVVINEKDGSNVKVLIYYDNFTKKDYMLTTNNDVGMVGYKVYNDNPETFEEPKGIVLHCALN